MRLAGKRPEVVFIDFDDWHKRPKYNFEYQRLILGYEPTQDLRPFYKLDVILTSIHWKPEIGDLFEALKRYAGSISVLVADFEEDLGWYWTKETGKVGYGDTVQ
jgi:hypothetical protein